MFEDANTRSMHPAPDDETRPSPAVDDFAERLQQLAESEDGESKPLHMLRSASWPEVPGFDCLQELGRGGMGVVYKARQAALNRHVALKVIRDSAEAGPVEVARFMDEAETVAAIDHPNVVRVHDYGEYRNAPYLVMEFLPGGSLAERLNERSPMTPQAAATLVEKLGRGVQAAHALGIIHRDLKPGNVLLDAGGEPKVVDFGLAKRGPSRHTTTGAIMGTPEYMAPEQAKGHSKHAGAPVDIWALGVILYECLTGRRPFTGSDDMPRAQQALMVLRRIESDIPARPRETASEIPRDLELICLKCLEKEPGDRYPTVAAFADDLRRFLRHESVSVRAPRIPERVWKWSRRHRTLAALYTVSMLATVALLGLGFWFSHRVGAADGDAAAARSNEAAANAEARRTHQEATTREYRGRLLDAIQDQQSRHRPGWATSGLKTIRQLFQEGMIGDLSVTRLRTEAVERLTALDVAAPREIAGIQAAAIAFHPEGKWVALGQAKSLGGAKCNILLVDPSTGTLQRTLTFYALKLFEDRTTKPDGPRCLAVSPNGRWLLAGTRSGRLLLWDLSIEEPEVQSWTGHGVGVEVTQVAFSPNGSCFYSGAADGNLKRWEAAGAKPVPLWKAGGPIRTILPTADGAEVACVYSADKADAVILSASTLKPVSELWKINTGGFARVPGSELWANINGSSISLIDPRWRNSKTHRQFRVQDRENAHEAGVRRIAVSPDGRWLASSGDDHHIRLWDMIGGRLLVDIPIALGDHGALGWHPRGTSLVAAVAGRVLVYDLSTSEISSSLPLPGFGLGVAFSPDGSNLAAVAASNRGFDELQFVKTPLAVSEGRSSVQVRIRLAKGHRIPGRTSPNGVQFSPDGTKCAIRTMAGLSIFDPSSPLVPMTIPSPETNAVSWGVDNSVWACSGTSIRSWLMPDGTPSLIHSNAFSDWVTGRGTLNSVAAGRAWVLSASRDYKVELLHSKDARTARLWHTSASVECVTLSSDESVAALGTESGEVRVFRIPSGEILGESLTGHGEAVHAAVFVTNRLLATGGRDGIIRFWGWTDGRLFEILSLRTTSGIVALSTNGSGSILSAAVNGELGIRLWRMDHLWDEMSRLGLDPGFDRPRAIRSFTP